MTTKKTKVVATVPATKTQRIKKKLSEGTTWAGLLTVAAAVASGGATVLTSPTLLTQIAGGIALILAKEG